MSKKQRFILASSSTYRQALLRNMGLDIQAISPGVIESRSKDESPADVALRLGLAKASAVAGQLDASQPWVVAGSDQVCHLDGQVFDKPGDHPTAAQHLAQFSGQWVNFTSSIALVSHTGTVDCDTEDFGVQFRSLTMAEIDSYLHLDKPYDCAGAIKAEKFGISLLNNTRGRDINVLYGLPVMRMFEFLRARHYAISDFNLI